MRKTISMILSCVLLLFSLSGCHNSDKNHTFDTLGITFDGGKTLNMEMDQEAVRKVMGKEPTETKEEYGEISDYWDLDYWLCVDYKAESPYKVTHIFVGLKDLDFETSLGISKGDSVASMKETLGDLYSQSDSEDNISYFYAFRYADGKYEMVDPNKSIGELTGGSEDIGLYGVSFTSENDTVIACSLSDAMS